MGTLFFELTGRFCPWLTSLILSPVYYRDSRFILHLPFTGRVRAATGAPRGRRPQDSPPSLGGRRPRNRCGCPQQLPPPGAVGRHPKEPLRPPAAADPRSRRCPQQLHSPQAPTREIQRLLGRARPGQSAEATAASPSSRSEPLFMLHLLLLLVHLLLTAPQLHLPVLHPPQYHPNTKAFSSFTKA
ncbi:uncharacterized protein LOC120674651 [Panicum virgatum]|uniref:uncharacterized protein LOC120674651 n=1 Tax=Panicum virgatum TaxID=38727 RepID=UPI0019D684CD|nr:uncharacterized protein LOC120674651 [Panicum virgatum]